jgi:CBS domain-containing protein
MKALDIMTPRVVTIRSDATIGEAIRVMLQNRISGLPVVDQAGNLVGIVTEGDFLRRAEDKTEKQRSRWLEFLLGPGRLASDYVHTHGRLVREVMTKDVATAGEYEPVENIVQMMEKRRIKRIPIVRGNKIVGVISRANLLHILGRLVADAQPAAQSDTEIRSRILAELDKQSWAPNTALNVLVHDGVVELKGAIFDERQRAALKVVAENIPGVKQVRDHLIWIEPISGMTMDPPAEEPSSGVSR